MGLTVAVTGPTGEIGISAVDALERDERVETILGMARRPFDVEKYGWTKTQYRQGDILDASAVAGFVAEADVVVHLAFMIMGSRSESARINIEGTHNVFEATVAAQKPRRLVYTSSVAAYGYHSDNPTPLTEDTPTRGSSEHYYSEQKATLEAVLAEVTNEASLEVFVLRPCIVAGPKATALADSMPWNAIAEHLPSPLTGLISAVPFVRPVIPDPGHPLQLIHHDDVATAIATAVTTDAKPGAFNLAGTGEITMSDVARALGAVPIPVPASVGRALSAAISALPVVPSLAEWVHVIRTSVVMDTSRAHDELGWAPKYSSKDTLDALAAHLNG